jgi:N-acetylmuramoyl-L-alanine amidase
MKLAQLLVLMAACAGWQGEALAQGWPGHSGRLDVYGKSFVPLADWAGKNNFSIRWLSPGNTVQLANRETRITISRDTREAELNGVDVCLSYPMVVRNGAGYISQVDLETAIGPILFPAKNPRGAIVRNIVIDPGHGGKDPGEQDGSHKEKTYTLLLGQELRDELIHAGFNASLTRTADTFVPLPERPEIARRRNADLFISLHWNTLPGNRSVQGAQTFCLTPAGASSSNAGGSLFGADGSMGNRNNAKNMLLAYCLQKSLLHMPGVEDRGVRRARYWVLREAMMPAVLIEGGFMSNPAESKRIYDPAYRRQMARAIVDGIIAYKRAVE